MTTPGKVALAALVAASALLAAGCGGSSNVPSGSIAVVNGTEISRSELDGWLAQAKKSYRATKQEFPKVGTTEYQNLQTQYVAFLVQREEFQQAAKDLGVTVTAKDIDKGVRDYIKQKFGGNRKKFEQALETQDFPESLFRKTILVTVLYQKIFEQVTKDVKVTTKDAQSYYNQNLSTYEQKASREVRHILIAKKEANGQVDYAKSKAFADQLYTRLQRGADFAALAKKYSADTSSAVQGGKYTAFKGQTVPEFDQAAFSLGTGEISKPVKTTYGYHIIQALTKISPGKTTPFSQAEAAIKQTLLQQKKQQVMYDWTQKLYKKYKSKISYAAGFAPPDLPETTETATQ
jgi:parvulin-like peptidyl-prolyl isomerase